MTSLVAALFATADDAYANVVTPTSFVAVCAPKVAKALVRLAMFCPAVALFVYATVTACPAVTAGMVSVTVAGLVLVCAIAVGVLGDPATDTAKSAIAAVPLAMAVLNVMTRLVAAVLATNADEYDKPPVTALVTVSRSKKVSSVPAVLARF
jgi:hypothetical protein